MLGESLTWATWGKVLPERPTFQPYWGKPAVRNDRGGGGNVGIIRSPLPRHHLTRPGLIGVIVTLALTHTTLNIQSLMGVVMLQGMVVSNSILIVDFANALRSEGHSVREAVANSCRIRLRPILMTSLATIVGLLPMALKLETGSEAYAPLALAIFGGLTSSIVLTIFVVPAAYLLIYQRSEASSAAIVPEEAR